MLFIFASKSFKWLLKQYNLENKKHDCANGIMIAGISAALFEFIMVNVIMFFIYLVHFQNLTGFIAGIKYFVRCFVASIAVLMIGLMADDLEYLWYIQAICFATGLSCLLFISLFMN